MNSADEPRSKYFKKGPHYPIWSDYKNDQGQPRGKYKIHLSIHPDEFKTEEFAKTKNEIDSLLEAAMDSGLITHYKMCDVNYVKNKNLDGREDIQRQMHNPYVIYLNDNYDENNLSQLSILCEKIENILKNTKSGDVNKLVECDLPVREHIIFRQAYLNKDINKENYIETKDADGLSNAGVKQLKIEGENSAYFRALSPSAALKTENDKPKVEQVKQVKSILAIRSVICFILDDLSSLNKSDSISVKIKSKLGIGSKTLDDRLNLLIESVQNQLTNLLKSSIEESPAAIEKRLIEIIEKVGLTLSESMKKGDLKSAEFKKINDLFQTLNKAIKLNAELDFPEANAKLKSAENVERIGKFMEPMINEMTKEMASETAKMSPKK